MTKNKKLYFLILILMIGGLAASIKLLHIDYNVAFDGNFKPSCDVNETVSCSKVAESKYAFILGIPVASFGIMGYLFMIAYLLFSRKRKDIYNNLFIFLSIFSMVSLYFFIVAKVILGAVCLYCSTTYGINWILTIIVGVYLFIINRKEITFSPITSIKTLFGVPFKTIPVYGVIALGVLIPSYIGFTQQMAKMCLEKGVNCSENGTCMIMHGKSECFCDSGYMSIDQTCIAEDKIKIESPYPQGSFDQKKMIGVVESTGGEPVVTVIVYSDYECPYCSRFEESLQRSINELDGVKLIRKEFPLDQKCNILVKRRFHEHACGAARFVKCAGVQGKFWESGYYLHHNRKKLGPDYYEKYIKLLHLDPQKMEKCMKSEEINTAIKSEILEAMKLGMRGTPGILVNKEVLSGNIPYKELKQIFIDAGATPRKTAVKPQQ